MVPESPQSDDQYCFHTLPPIQTQCLAFSVFIILSIFTIYRRVLANHNLFHRALYRRNFFPFKERQRKGHTSDSPAIHQKDDYDTGCFRKIPCDPCGHTHGTNGGKYFKQYVLQCERLEITDHDGSTDGHEKADEHYIAGFADGVIFKPPSKHIVPF